MKNWRITFAVLTLSLTGIGGAAAQEGHSPSSHGPMGGMDHGRMHEGMDHGPSAGTGAMGHDAAPETDGGHRPPMHPGHTEGMDHGGSAVEHAPSGMDHGAAATGGHMRPAPAVIQLSSPAVHSMAGAQGGSAPADARDPDAYSEGLALGARHPHMGGHTFGSLRADRLEAVHTSEHDGAAYELQAWYGGDFDRAVLKAEGDLEEGTLQEASTELLWSHAVAAYWDAQLGVRHDSGEAPDRNWLALGLQGLAPYFFELDATAYLGDQGRSALRLGAEYELLFTQRLILQSGAEANLQGKRDPARGLGSGLSDLSAGLRLRYEFRRQMGPYVGVEWQGLYGETADFAREAGAPTQETRWVAGVRFWI